MARTPTCACCPYRKLDPTGVQPRIGRCFLVWGFFWQGISGRRSSDPSSSKGSNSGEPRVLGIALGQANSGPGASGLMLQRRWQLMGALEATDGMLLFGISTAYMFTMMQAYWPMLMTHRH
jgi:hypothetical protein